MVSPFLVRPAVPVVLGVHVEPGPESSVGRADPSREAIHQVLTGCARNVTSSTWQIRKSRPRSTVPIAGRRPNAPEPSLAPVGRSLTGRGSPRPGTRASSPRAQTCTLTSFKVGYESWAPSVAAAIDA